MSQEIAAVEVVSLHRDLQQNREVELKPCAAWTLLPAPVDTACLSLGGGLRGPLSIHVLAPLCVLV